MLRLHYPNTKKFNEIIQDYTAGNLLDKDNKEFTADFIVSLLKKHQKKVQAKKKIAEKIVFG